MCSGRQDYDLRPVFESLAKSSFRSRFRLGENESEYLQKKGIAAIEQHARDFVNKRLAPARPKKDGSQTPMKNHPVFIAQHATATCCRGCLEKWHGIKKGNKLSDPEIDYCVAVIMHWIEKHSQNELTGG